MFSTMVSVGSYLKIIFYSFQRVFSDLVLHMKLRGAVLLIGRWCKLYLFYTHFFLFSSGRWMTKFRYFTFIIKMVRSQSALVRAVLCISLRSSSLRVRMRILRIKNVFGGYIGVCHSFSCIFAAILAVPSGICRSAVSESLT
eukprot:IDg8770t1